MEVKLQKFLASGLDGGGWRTSRSYPPQPRANSTQNQQNKVLGGPRSRSECRTEEKCPTFCPETRLSNLQPVTVVTELFRPFGRCLERRLIYRWPYSDIKEILIVTISFISLTDLAFYSRSTLVMNCNVYLAGLNMLRVFACEICMWQLYTTWTETKHSQAYI
jgi:hypothetical protein